MRIEAFILSLALLTLLRGPCWCQDDAKAILAQSVATRSSIKSGRIVLHSSMKLEEKGSDPSTIEEDRSIWFDESKIRNDKTRKLSREEKLRQREVEIKNYDKDGRWLAYREASGEYVLVGRNPNQPKNAPCLKILSVFDARVLGYNLGYIHGFSLESPNLAQIFDEPVLQNSTVHKVGRRSGDEYEIGSTYRDTERSVIRILPACGYIPVFISGEGGDATYSYRYEIDVTPKLYGDNWFFSKYTLIQKNTDRQFTEVVTIKEAEFNRPLDPAVFTLKGIGVPVGTELKDCDTGKKTRITDGVMILPAQAEAPDPQAQPLAPVPGRLNGWVLAGVIVGVALGVFFLYRALLRRG